MNSENASRTRTGGTPRLGATVLGWVLFVVPFVVHFWLVARYASNVPRMDDFDAILGFLEKWVAAPNLGTRLRLLFEQHNEHRILTVRLLCLADFWVWGEISFWRMAMCGAAAWSAAVGLLAWTMKTRWKLSVWELLPIPYILFAPTHFDLFLWAGPSVQNYGVFLFVIPFLACLADRRDGWLNLLFPLALFTSGAGLLLYPLGLAEFLWSRRWKSALIFGATGGVFLALYFSGYQRNEFHPTLAQTLSDPVRGLRFILAFLGSYLGTELADTWLPEIIGGATIVALLVGVARRWSDRFLWLLSGFVLLTALVTALVRSATGAQYALESRYAMYHQLAWVAVYAYLLLAVREKRRPGPTMVFAGSLAVALYALALRTDVGLLQLQNFRESCAVYAYRKGIPNFFHYLSPEAAAERLQSSRQLGIYDAATAVSLREPRQVGREELQSAQSPPGRLRLETLEIDAVSATLIGAQMEDSTLSLVLDGGGPIYALPFQSFAGLKAVSGRDRQIGPEESVFWLCIAAYRLPGGHYNGGLLHESPAGRKCIWLRDLRIEFRSESEGALDNRP